MSAISFTFFTVYFMIGLMLVLNIIISMILGFIGDYFSIYEDDELIEDIVSTKKYCYLKVGKVD